MRVLLAAVSAVVALALLAAGFMALLGDYQRRHGDALRADVTLAADGQIRIDGQPISLQQFRALWQDGAFRQRHCDRWQVIPDAGAPAGRAELLARLVTCRPGEGSNR